MAEPRRAAFRFSVFGLVLILLGVLFLLHNLGVVSWGVWGTLWRFWPVILVVIGLNILWGGRRPWLVLLASAVLLVGVVVAAIVIAGTSSTGGPTSFSQPVAGIVQAEIEISLGAGELNLGSLPQSSANLIEGTANPDLSSDFNLRGSTGVLTVKVPGRRLVVPVGDSGIRLDANLSPSLPSDLTIKSGAVRGKVDLSALKVVSLRMDIGASDIDLLLPANAGFTQASVKAGAASLTITIPVDVAAKIDISAGLSSIRVDSRFPKSGGVYQSPDYTTATNRVDLRVEAGVSSIDIQ